LNLSTSSVLIVLTDDDATVVIGKVAHAVGSEGFSVAA